MRLYLHPMLTNSRRAAMTAVHLDLPIQLERVDLGKGEQRRPEFLALNPNGRVPVLDDDGFILTESHAIMMYLADRVPGQTLLPAERRARADVTRWLFWSAQHFQPAASIFGWETVIKPMLGQGDPDPRELARGERLFAECGRVLDAQLAARPWVVGAELTLADLALAATLGWSERAKLPVAPYPHILAWFARVQELAAWRKTAG